MVLVVFWFPLIEQNCIWWPKNLTRLWVAYLNIYIIWLWKMCSSLVQCTFWIVQFIIFVYSSLRWPIQTTYLGQFSFNPFRASVPIFYLLKTPEKLRFIGVFREYKIETLFNFLFTLYFIKIWCKSYIFPKVPLIFFLCPLFLCYCPEV